MARASRRWHKSRDGRHIMLARDSVTGDLARALNRRDGRAAPFLAGSGHRLLRVQEGLGRAQDGLDVELGLVQVDAGGHEVVRALEQGGHLVDERVVLAPEALAQGREVLALLRRRVAQRLHPLLGAGADDVLDLGGEPEEDEEVPEA